MWLVGSTPVGCGCSRETAKRPDLAGWAHYGYCASHSGHFWGCVCTWCCKLGGLPVLFALSWAKADECETLRDMLDIARQTSSPLSPGQTITGGKNQFGREFEHGLAEFHLRLVPARNGKVESAATPVQTAAAGHRVYQTFVGQLQLGTTRLQEPGRGVSPHLVPDPRTYSELAQRPDWKAIKRSLTAYDH